MRLKGISAIALLAVVPLAACGSSKTADQATSAATSAASSATDNTSASQSPSASASSPAASTSAAATPAGDKMVTDTAAKVQFAVPSSWVAVDAKTMNTPAVRKALTPMAQRNGHSVDQMLKQFMQDADLYLMSPSAADHGYNDNLSALKPRPSVDLDGAESGLKQSLEQEGATVSKQTHVQSALGEGLRTDYTMSVNGRTFSGASLVLPTSSGTLVPLTVSAGTAAQADRFAKDVLKTYRAA